MNVTQALSALERVGTELYRRNWARHGIRPPLFGVKYQDLYRLQKLIGVDHELALHLWKSGNHDARILATLVCDPDAFSSRELDAWIKVADNHVLNTAVSGVAARTRHAKKKADAWRKVKGEWKSAAGWDIVGHLAASADVSDAWLAARIEEVEAKIHDAPNRTRHSMNNALISIGGYRPALRAEALAAAKAIGKVEVDHGPTSCKTPDAVPYIKKMAKRHSKRKKKSKKKKKSKR